MKAHKEIVFTSNTSSFSCLEFRGKAFPSPYHFHPEIELTYIEASEGRRFVGEHVGRFAPGDLVLIGENVPHMYYNDPTSASEGKTAHSKFIQFNRSMFGDPFWDMPEVAGIDALLEKAKLGIAFHGDVRKDALRMINKILKTTGLKKMVHLLNLLQMLKEWSDVETLCTACIPVKPSQANARVSKAYEIINERFQEKLTLDRVASLLHLSPSAFSRMFSRTSGKTFSEFLSQIRIGYACQQLQDTDKGVLEICYDSGFSNLSNFNRRFREHLKMTPSEYRKFSRV